MKVMNVEENIQMCFIHIYIYIYFIYMYSDKYFANIYTYMLYTYIHICMSLWCVFETEIFVFLDNMIIMFYFIVVFCDFRPVKL